MAHTSWRLERAVAASEEALALYRRAGDEAGETLMLFRLGTTCLDAGEIVRGRKALLEESLRRLSPSGQQGGRVRSGGESGLTRGDPR